MHSATLKQAQPLLGTRDVHAAARFYVESLGFELLFMDAAAKPNYSVVAATASKSTHNSSSSTR